MGRLTLLLTEYYFLNMLMELTLQGEVELEPLYHLQGCFQQTWRKTSTTPTPDTPTLQWFLVSLWTMILHIPPSSGTETTRTLTAAVPALQQTSQVFVNQSQSQEMTHFSREEKPA